MKRIHDPQPEKVSGPKTFGHADLPAASISELLFAHSELSHDWRLLVDEHRPDGARAISDLCEAILAELERRAA